MVRVCRVIPKDWEKYTAIGEVIPRTRFIVFKTPINDVLATKLPKESRFNTTDLFRKLAEKGKRLGLVVDLTDTDRYYDKNDITGMCVEYEKVNCPGRGFIDRDECIEGFNQAIQNYTDNTDDDEALIGVHCTHGINRSGYLICRFLIERLGWSSHEAIEAFEHSRGHSIAKGAYVMALHKAAKDSRNKKVESDTDSEERRRRKKNKRKHKEENPQMEMFSAMLGEIEQTVMATNYEHSPSVNGYGTPEEQQQQHWGYAAKKRKYQSMNQPQITPTQAKEEVVDEEVEEEEEYEEGAEMDEGLDESGSGAPRSASSKRRARRNRTQQMLHVMARGNFHEIQAMKEQIYVVHGAARNQ